MTQWSYSGLKDYEQCARKYNEVKVLKRYPKLDSEANLYGGQLHKQAEEFIKDGKPLDPGFKFLKPILDAIVAMPGEKLCEFKMGLREDLSPCDFFDPDFWVRGVADLIVIAPDRTTARCFDYKSGSDRYPDTDQLLLMALMIFQLFPTVQRVSSGLLFVLKGTVAKHKVQRANAAGAWWRWRERVARLERAHTSGHWPPKQSGLCKKHCPVKSCEFQGA
jgi:hypothetical protein